VKQSRTPEKIALSCARTRPARRRKRENRRNARQPQPAAGAFPCWTSARNRTKNGAGRSMVNGRKSRNHG
jgi:hypothetical protein